ncbi:hypothetical protein LTR86_009648 [Recurvomyces mirabilis]|nr:hypothetical protein LTR86_009648 [Recurvomyces mirabilis]
MATSSPAPPACVANFLDAKCFFITKLTPDIRQKIYRHLFPVSRTLPAATRPPLIAQICQLLRDEALEIWRAHNKFTVRYSDDGDGSSFELLARLLKRSGLKYMTKFTLFDDLMIRCGNGCTIRTTLSLSDNTYTVSIDGTCSCNKLYAMEVATRLAKRHGRAMAAALELWMAPREFEWRKFEKLDWEILKDHQFAVEESENEDDCMAL